MQCIYRYLSSKMHLHSKATVHFCWHYVRDEFFRWRGHRLPSSSFSERLPTPSSLSAPGFNPVFALTTNPLASSCQSALPPVVSWFKVQFIVMSLCTCIHERKGVIGPENIPGRVLMVCAERLKDVSADILLNQAATGFKGSTIIVPKGSNLTCPRLVTKLDPLQFAYRADQSAVDAVSKWDSCYKQISLNCKVCCQSQFSQKVIRRQVMWSVRAQPTYNSRNARNTDYPGKPGSSLILLPPRWSAFPGCNSFITASHFSDFCFGNE